MCVLLLNMCLVGAVNTGPDVYSLQFLDNTAEIREYRLELVDSALNFDENF